ncbi:MAG: hypothetical protein ACM3ZR_07535 [Pseudomonadota bacterium]
MKIIENMPIIVIVAANLANIAIGVRTRTGFPVLMMRCIVVTIVFGVLSYMLTKTITNAIECSQMKKLAAGKDEKAISAEGHEKTDNKNSFDIKVPPLDDEELLSINKDSDNDFIELNPVRLKSFRNSDQN